MSMPLLKLPSYSLAAAKYCTMPPPAAGSSNETSLFGPWPVKENACAPILKSKVIGPLKMEKANPGGSTAGTIVTGS
jgi:hypothetical protein